MAVSEFAFAHSALLSTLLVPFFLFYQMLRVKRGAIRINAPVATARGNRR